MAGACALVWDCCDSRCHSAFRMGVSRGRTVGEPTLFALSAQPRLQLLRRWCG